MSNWTPEEAARMLAGRINQPHYVESVIRKVLAQDRAAVVVELPPRFDAGFDAILHEHQDGEFLEYEATVEAIRAAGIKIKGDV